MKYDSDWWDQTLLHAGVVPSVAGRWAGPLAANVGVAAFSKGESEIADFMGQALYETALLSRLEENLNYSAGRLQQVWPHRFPGLASAAPYAYSPEKLANLVYGGRMGNTASGDGWTYRGRGIPMITGKANYVLVGEHIGVDLLTMPALLTDPNTALLAALAWWEKSIPDSIIGDSDAITHRVQGGDEGAARRAQLTSLIRGCTEGRS